jgi:hypothetical protein
MFTRAAGPACVNGCVRGEPHAGQGIRAGGRGLLGDRASVLASSGTASVLASSGTDPSIARASSSSAQGTSRSSVAIVALSSGIAG